MKLKADKIEHNKYRPQSSYIKEGFTHILDGLIQLITLGHYQGCYTIELVEQRLRFAMELHRKERKERDEIRGNAS